MSRLFFLSEQTAEMREFYPSTVDKIAQYSNLLIYSYKNSGVVKATPLFEITLPVLLRGHRDGLPAGSLTTATPSTTSNRSLHPTAVSSYKPRFQQQRAACGSYHTQSFLDCRKRTKHLDCGDFLLAVQCKNHTYTILLIHDFNWRIVPIENDPKRLHMLRIAV